MFGFVNFDVLDAKVSKFYELGRFFIICFCLECLGYNGFCSFIAFFLCVGEFRSWALIIEMFWMQKFVTFILFYLFIELGDFLFLAFVWNA